MGRKIRNRGLTLEIDGIVGTGAATVAAPAAYTAATISNPPTQAEVQAVADALETLRGEMATFVAEFNKTVA